MASCAFKKVKKVKKTWTKRIEKSLEGEEVTDRTDGDGSFMSSDESGSALLEVRESPNQFRWSMNADEQIVDDSSSDLLNKVTKSNRITDGDLYLSDEEDEVFADEIDKKYGGEEAKSSELTVGSTVDDKSDDSSSDGLESVSSVQREERKKKKSRKKSKKKGKKKKKKKMKSAEQKPKSSSSTSTEDASFEGTDHIKDTTEPGIPEAADDGPDGPEVPKKQWRPRPSNRQSRHSILQDKIRTSLAGLGERNTIASLILESDNERGSDEMIICNQRLFSDNTEFLAAFDSSERGSVLKRLSQENQHEVENLLDELHQYEEQLEEERNEISKERAMMQMKQESVEQMLEAELDKTSQLESRIRDLEEKLEDANKATGDHELLQKIKMLETENELLQQKTERQKETIAKMAKEQTPAATSDSELFLPLPPSSLISSQSLPAWHVLREHGDASSDDGSVESDFPGAAKAQGELLQLRSAWTRQQQAFEEQSRELAKLRSNKKDDRIKELQKALANMEQQKDYFMKETKRQKKMLASKSTNRSSGWFDFSFREADESTKSFLDLDETEAVY
mmetsp:Transcript_41442/g.99826  ORF Transcript_41442/g.99826 Transcript_41442/m.99826 type:complete len:567 (+) Transcript_41442:61-1761(+)